MKARRIDTTTAAIVDKGIQFQELFGTKFAAEYLSFHKVSMEVTIRVLTRPQERRFIKMPQNPALSNNHRHFSLAG